MKTRILCGILGFFLALALLLPQLAITLYAYFFNANTFRSLLCSDESVAQIRQYLLSEGESVADACGLPYTVFDEAFPAAELKQEMEAVLTHLFDGDGYTVSTEALRLRLRRSVEQALSELTDVGDLSAYTAEIDGFCEQIASVYTRSLQLKVFPYFSRVQGLIHRVMTVAWIAFAVVCLPAIVCMALLLRKAGAVLREIAFSLLASGGFVALGSLLVHHSGMLANLQIQPAYFRSFLLAYIADGLRHLATVGGCTVALGALLLVLSWLLSKKGNVQSV